MIIHMKLNPQQPKAVNHSKGPLLIVAGAGTGKTTVITERIKHLIQDKKVDPQQIFATSFTHKSAEEMLSRLDHGYAFGLSRTLARHFPLPLRTLASIRRPGDRPRPHLQDHDHYRSMDLYQKSSF